MNRGNTMLTVIMAGGKGSRISDYFPDIPKPLIPIDGIPVLEREIVSLCTQGFTEIILTVSFMANKIREYFGDGSRLGVKIEYYEENNPIGNAGALYMLRDRIGTAPFLLLNADVMFDVDFNRMVDYHFANNAMVTIFTHPNSHPFDSGLIIANETKQVVSWIAKEDDRPIYYKNRVNAGIHIVDPKVLDFVGIDGSHVGTISEVSGKIIKVDLDRQVLRPLAGKGVMYCYDSSEYVKDMGTWERYESVVRDFKAGIVHSKNLLHKQRAVFLDRDGTINKYVGFLRRKEQFELIDGVADAIKRINSLGYLVIVVTNQPVIARGDITVCELNEIHMKMETELGFHGAYLDGVYYCPHHPDRGYDGEIDELKIECDCRKPKPGMLIKAAEDFNISLSDSFMIGDSENDIKAGNAAGCKSVLLSGVVEDCENNYCGQFDSVSTLADFVDKYL